MTENEEFEKICKEASMQLGVGRTEFAEVHLNIDPKTYRKYCTQGNIPKHIWLKALSIATGEPEKSFEEEIARLFRQLYEKAMGRRRVN